MAVLGDGYLPAVEIIPKGAYFDYFCKYQKDGAQEICPAPITDEQWRTVGELALRLHRALGLAVYSRADFILDEEGRFWCLEINTLPGMTPTSLVPQEAAQVGLSYGDLCQQHCGRIPGPAQGRPEHEAPGRSADVCRRRRRDLSPGRSRAPSPASPATAAASPPETCSFPWWVRGSTVMIT